MKILLLLILVVVSVLQTPIIWAQSKKSFTGVSYDVGFKFFKAINRSAESNILFSPTTLTSLYGLIYATSLDQLKTEINTIIFPGWTESQIYDAMSAYDKSIDRLNTGTNIRVTSANKIYRQKDTADQGSIIQLPSRDLNKLLADTFDTSVDELDFVNRIDYARALINQWIASKSQNKIKLLYKPSDLGSDAVMALASGAALDGTFTYGFNAKDTKTRLFYPNAQTATVGQSVSQTCARLFYGETSDAIAVGLPYGIREQVVVFFIMPKVRYQLASLEQKLIAQDHLTELMDNSVDYAKVVTVILPKFKLDLDPYDLRVALMLMGTTTMFANGFVNFSKINGRQNLYVSHGKHKSYFEVREGTSRLCPNDTNSGLDKVEVNFNQPFIVAVVEKSTRNLLLYGRLASVD